MEPLKPCPICATSLFNVGSELVHEALGRCPLQELHFEDTPENREAWNYREPDWLLYPENTPLPYEHCFVAIWNPGRCEYAVLPAIYSGSMFYINDKIPEDSTEYSEYPMEIDYYIPSPDPPRHKRLQVKREADHE